MLNFYLSNLPTIKKPRKFVDKVYKLVYATKLFTSNRC